MPLAWLGALPEAVVRARKEGASDNDVIRFFSLKLFRGPRASIIQLHVVFVWKCLNIFFSSLLGSNVDAESYEGDVCGDTLANTRCYAQVVLLNILLC